jgi:hypothetical protein
MLRSAVFLVLAGIAMQGCAWYVYDATGRPIASRITGKCFALREDAILSEHFSYFTAYMLNLAGADECTPAEVTPVTKDEGRYKSSGFNYPKCIWVPVANVARETQFRVTTITEQPYGGPGRCWKVEVTLITGKYVGIKSGIPACHFDFAAPELWIEMKSGNEYVEPLLISSRVARPCAE